MGNFANNAVTDGGRLLLADLQAGAVFIPTKIVIGSGTIPSGKTAATMTAVSTPVKELAINKKKKTADGKVIVGGAYDNRDVTVAWYFRELALFARAEYREADGTVTKSVDEVLYSYGNAGDTADYMPAYSTDAVVERQIDLVSWVGQGAEIELTIESGVQVTQEQKDTPGGIVGIDEDGNANMNGGTITGLGTPVYPSDAVPKSYADLMLPIAGGTMFGNIHMFGGKTVTGIPSPTSDSDAVPKSYVVEAAKEVTVKAGAPFNFVLNSNFRDPVNNKGKKIYTGGGNTIDRWAADSDIEVTVYSGYVGIKNNDTGSYRDFEQKLYDCPLKVGTVYTGVFALNDGTVYTGSVKAAAVDTNIATNEDETVLFQLCTGESYHAIRFRIASGKNVPVAYCALYEGEFESVALPAFRSDHYNVEDLKCNGFALTELLWENASPYSGFAEQTIEIDMSLYTAFAIVARATSRDSHCFTCIVCNLSGGYADVTGHVSSNTGRYSREVRFDSDGIWFNGYGYHYGYGSDGITSGWNEGYAIPYKIYGIR